jgi:hypothetical protein
MDRLATTPMSWPVTQLAIVAAIIDQLAFRADLPAIALVANTVTTKRLFASTRPTRPVERGA